MSILSLRRPSAKLHPYAPTRRGNRRPFAEGLLVDEAPAPVNRVAAFLAPSADPDSIPASVQFVRLLNSAAAGEFRRRGETWARITDGRLICGATADREYRNGRVAIISRPSVEAQAPAPSTKILADLVPIGTKPQADRIPTMADRLWALGYELGRQGIDGKACSDWPAESRAAFDDGLASGEQSRIADMDHALEVDTCRSQSWDDELERHEAHELAEAGVFPGRGVAND